MQNNNRRLRFSPPVFLPNLDSSEERGVVAANIQGHICWSGNERFVTRFLLSEAGVKRVHGIKLMRRLGSGKRARKTLRLK